MSLAKYSVNGKWGDQEPMAGNGSEELDKTEKGEHEKNVWAVSLNLLNNVL